MDIEHDPDVRIQRDGDAVRQVLHLARPFTHDAVESAANLVALYLHVHARLFGLDRLSLPPVAVMPPVPFWAALARFLGSLPVLGRLLWPLLTRGARLDPEPSLVTVRNRESVAVIFRQVLRVYVGLRDVDIPVRGAGIRVMVALSPLRVTGAYSTLRTDLAPAIRSRPFPITAEAAADAFNIPRDTVEGLFIDGRPATPGGPRSQGLAPVLVYGRMDDPGLGDANEGRRLPHREYLDLVSRTVVRREVLASHVRGLAFTVDPCSQDPQAVPLPAPYRPAGDLDPYRTHQPLWNLTPPAPGAQQQLRGPRVYVAQDNPLGIAPPTQPVGANFDYTSRSNHFAAVSAYYHCDAAFRMIEALGFPPANYFAANVAAGKFPIRVVHRAPISPGRAVFDGRTVNAQVVPVIPRNDNVVDELRFAFADLSDPVAAPLGIAADARFVWHEFCHALLIAATGAAEFPFAHSAGDALAAIICDLDSRIGELAPAWRGVTFPWVEALRRHDRAVGEGWGWHGSLYSPVRDMRDPAGYRGEQILSSTLFRLYRALGGDAKLASSAPDLVPRRAAAAYTVYLIVRAIKGLGPVATTPAGDADALARALMEADVTTSFLLPDQNLFPPFTAPERRGGAVHKVVRWAFERQGLYAPPAGPRPWNAPGQPEAVDVYIEDRHPRRGEYDYTTNWDTDQPHVRIAAQPNPGDPDASPRANTPSYVFVRVQNRGIDPSPAAATMKVFAARAPGPNPPDWRLAPGPPNPWVELAAIPGAVTTAVVIPGASVDFGPFEWRPQAPVRHGLLACVDAPGDRCNALVLTYACAVGPTPLAHLVPFDNNIGYRGVVVLP